MINKLLPTKLSQNIAGLFVSNLVAFLVIGLSYIIYSKTLKPDEFGLYSVALAIGNFGTLVLDGGLKNTIIKSTKELSKEQEGALLFLMICSSIVAIFILYAIKGVLTHNFKNTLADYNFLALFSGIFWLSYPWIAIPTATLERSLSYKGIAWIESIGTILERALPALILVSSELGIYSFVWALLISRSFRVICMNILHKPVIYWPSWKQIKAISGLLSEGVWLQLGVGASLIRDNLHAILVGVMFGKAWVGYYAWALQLSAISSQVFVQIAARVSIPLFARAESFEERWKSCLYQIKLLTIVITPVLGVVLILIPSVNEQFFGGKWTTAIALLPLLFFRMLPGLATTPISSILMVQRGGKSLAKANLLWTGLEFVTAAFCLKLLGPMGLAWSYAVVVWAGLYLFLFFLDQRPGQLVFDTVSTLVKRSSLFTTVLLSLTFLLYSKVTKLGFGSIQYFILVAISILVLAYLSEKDVRKFVGSIK